MTDGRVKSPEESIFIDNIHSYLDLTYKKSIISGYPNDLQDNKYFLGYLLGLSSSVSKACQYENTFNTSFSIFKNFTGKIFKDVFDNNDLENKLMDLNVDPDFLAGIEEAGIDLNLVYEKQNSGSSPNEWILTNLKNKLEELGYF